MSLPECQRDLQSFLQNQQLKECKVVVLPDFFLDRIINLELNTSDFSILVDEVAKRKGGSIDGISQTDLRGGNAINVGSALASLGSEVTPIVSTSHFGLQQIKYHFKNSSIDTSHVKTGGKASMTTAMEFKNEGKIANVMIRDLGALADFGPANLDEEDYSLIEASDYVCLFDWAGTLKFGTALAQTIFDRIKQKGEGKTYYGTADPNPNSTAISDLMAKVLKTDKVDILSLNENEAITYASILDDGLNEGKARLEFAELAMEAARVLAKWLPARIDLHATAFSATFKGKNEVVVPAFNVKVFRATGAGDAWDAGNILGDHNGLSDESRLMLANTLAACYLSDPDGLHPTKEKLSSFLRDYS
jgi:sugar/nucleoside kinase (ribokinase family)